ncbi:MAG: Holliday junction resolvase RuvX [Pseudomonadota bacterium]|nr:Holliday junction resolvase RuvX [Pseudomonadota bacterium]
MNIETLPIDCTLPVAALSFDYGTRRIGVAFGQSVSATTKAITVLKAKDGIPDWEEVGKLLQEWKPDCCVVGLPYNLDGSENELLSRAIKFANRINGRFNIKCYGMDERLSTKAAIEQVMEDEHASKNKITIDDIAAQIILENWFNEFNSRV